MIVIENDGKLKREIIYSTGYMTWVIIGRS